MRSTADHAGQREGARRRRTWRAQVRSPTFLESESAILRKPMQRLRARARCPRAGARRRAAGSRGAAALKSLSAPARRRLERGLERARRAGASMNASRFSASVQSSAGFRKYTQAEDVASGSAGGEHEKTNPSAARMTARPRRSPHSPPGVASPARPRASRRTRRSPRSSTRRTSPITCSARIRSTPSTPPPSVREAAPGDSRLSAGDDETAPHRRHEACTIWLRTREVRLKPSEGEPERAAVDARADRSTNARGSARWSANIAPERREGAPRGREALDRGRRAPRFAERASSAHEV